MTRSEIGVHLLELLNKEGCVTIREERMALHHAIEEFMSPVMTFGELEPGSHFIALPRAGDDSGHGGLRGRFIVFERSRYRKEIAFNSHGVESSMPESMPVLQVVIDGVFF